MVFTIPEKRKDGVERVNQSVSDNTLREMVEYPASAKDTDEDAPEDDQFLLTMACIAVITLLHDAQCALACVVVAGELVQADPGIPE